MAAVDIDGPDGLKARLNNSRNKDEQRYCRRPRQIQSDLPSLLNRIIVVVILNSLRWDWCLFWQENVK